ncbi:MAG: dTMP kinase [Clostridia bacterium]|nr:dTMP kinase [Clostridia bacterium]
MKFDYYLFDFDGTVCQTGEGIRRSVAYALEKLGMPVPPDEVLDRFIGPPLLDSFRSQFHLDDAGAARVMAAYRERYIDIGLYESQVYPGIAQLLKALHERGAWVALASAKPAMMLERLTKHFGIDAYFDAVSGTMLGYHDADKKDLLLAALPEGADISRACMMGDRCFDIEAAKALGMTAVGADYGYSIEGELRKAGADRVFDSVLAMSEWLLDGDLPRGRFITMEGSDGCGKSTQIAKLRDYLTARGYDTVLTREPGGCPISERIREVILSLDSRGMSAECEALLYAASRVEHVREVIEPAIRRGRIVICDRFLDSSIAYQAYGRELGEAFVRQINAAAVKDVQPDATILLEVDRDRAKRRMAAGAPLDRLEIEQEDFFERVRRGYEAVKAASPERVFPIDAGRSIDEVFEDVKAVVDGIL